MNVRSRGWCLTHNNYSQEDYDAYTSHFTTYDYGIIAREVGEQGTPHLQMFFYLKNARTFSSIKKTFKTAHIEAAKGSPKQASDYCKKDGDYVEFGTLPQQGLRCDLNDLIQEIMNGRRVDEIAISDPMTYHLYGRTLLKAEDLYMRQQYRKEMTEGIWYWGSTGVGKSHTMYENYNPLTHYNWKNDNGWQDGYSQQDIVVINDFRGSIPYADLLQLVDKWPYELKRRNREPVPFVSKKVIITSSLPPEMVYKNLSQNDSLDQLYRRFKVIKMTTENFRNNFILGFLTKIFSR